MKKGCDIKRLITVFASFIILISLYGCINNNRIFAGFIVAKEYVPEHMSNESSYPISYAYVVPIFHHKPSPHKVDAKWVWFIANKYEILEKEVSKEMFDTKKCGERVTVKYW